MLLKRTGKSRTCQVPADDANGVRVGDLRAATFQPCQESAMLSRIQPLDVETHDG
jgi:hypothetical protein